MDPGQDDLGIAPAAQAAGPLDGRRQGDAGAPPAHRGNDAERAGHIAAVLNLEEGPGPEARGDGRRGRSGHSHRVQDLDGQTGLVPIGKDLPNAGHPGQAGGRSLSQASTDDDL